MAARSASSCLAGLWAPGGTHLGGSGHDPPHGHPAAAPHRHPVATGHHSQRQRAPRPSPGRQQQQEVSPPAPCCPRPRAPRAARSSSLRPGRPSLQLGAWQAESLLLASRGYSYRRAAATCASLCTRTPPACPLRPVAACVRSTSARAWRYYVGQGLPNSGQFIPSPLLSPDMGVLYNDGGTHFWPACPNADDPPSGHHGARGGRGGARRAHGLRLTGARTALRGGQPGALAVACSLASPF